MDPLGVPFGTLFGSKTVIGFDPGHFLGGCVAFWVAMGAASGKFREIIGPILGSFWGHFLRFFGIFSGVFF